MKKIVLAVSGDVNFGAIQYSDIVRTEFNLKKRAPESVVELIDSIVYDGGYSTITGAALTEANNNVHSGIFGGRSGTEFFPNTNLKFEFRKKIEKAVRVLLIAPYNFLIHFERNDKNYSSCD